VRVLEALKILEDATLDSKKRDIDTPEVREALDMLDPYCDPKWRVAGFRSSLQPHKRDIGIELEGQQQRINKLMAELSSSKLSLAIYFALEN